jgi:serine/threonine protein phosphatase PrpC
MGIAANIAEAPCTLGLSVGQHSVAGCKAQNEDAIGIRIPNGKLLASKGAAAVIADGVSAAEAGREASETCVSNFLSDYFSTPDVWTVKKSAQQVLTALNRWLYGRGQGYGDNQKGYVTTMSTLVFKSHTAHMFHIGDSRIYRLRDGELEQLTKDHATPISDHQTYLTRAVGLDVRLDVDYRAVKWRWLPTAMTTSAANYFRLKACQTLKLMTWLPHSLNCNCHRCLSKAWSWTGIAWCGN